jgi:hypothetical protein
MSLQKPQERTRPRATRESGMVRGLVDVSYIDDHVRRQTPAGQRGQAPRRASKERSRGLLRWKASPGSGAPVDIDVSLARTRTSDCHKGCSRTPEAAENKGDVRGLDPTERRSAEKATALSGPTEQATSRSRESAHPERCPGRSARSQRRAVKRVAVGGWMTARWSGVALGRGNASPAGDPEGERRRVYPRRSADGLRR